MRARKSSPLSSKEERMLCSLMWRLFALDIVDGGDPLRMAITMVIAITVVWT